MFRDELFSEGIRPSTPQGDRIQDIKETEREHHSSGRTKMKTVVEEKVMQRFADIVQGERPIVRKRASKARWQGA